MQSNSISFDQASAAMVAHYGDNAMQPNRKLSTYARGRWILRNVTGFLCFVSNGGKVWSFSKKED